jgi:hypothetical protein
LSIGADALAENDGANIMPTEIHDSEGQLLPMATILQNCTDAERPFVQRLAKDKMRVDDATQALARKQAHLHELERQAEARQRERPPLTPEQAETMRIAMVKGMIKERKPWAE